MFKKSHFNKIKPFSGCHIVARRFASHFARCFASVLLGYFLLFARLLIYSSTTSYKGLYNKTYAIALTKVCKCARIDRIIRIKENI